MRRASAFCAMGVRMEYRIGEFARHMGISTELLKHYEKLGLIAFRRDEANGYRWCDFAQCENLVATKALVTGRLALKDNALRNGRAGNEIDAVLGSLEGIEREFERELVLDRYAIERTREFKAIALRAREAPAPSAPIGVAGSRYFLKISDGETFCERSDEELSDFAQWRDCCPVTSFTMLRERGAGVSCGLMTAADFAEEYGLPVRFARRIDPPYFAYDILVDEGDGPSDLEALVERCTEQALAGTSMTAANLRCVAVEHFFYADCGEAHTRFARAWLLV